MDLERSFGYLVHDVARLFAQRFDQRALMYLGLNRSQCRILGYLSRHEGIHQAGLAELLEIKPMTLVRHIDRMEAEGWIARRPDPGDRRARRLVLTEKARPVLARILDLSADIRQEAFATFSEEESRHLVDLLRRVQSSLAGDAAVAPGQSRLAGRSAGHHRQDPLIDNGLAVIGSSR